MCFLCNGLVFLLIYDDGQIVAIKVETIVFVVCDNEQYDNYKSITK